MVGHNGIFEDYLDLGVRAVIDPQIRCYLEKTEDNTDNYDSYLGEAVYNLDLEGITAGEEVAEGVVVKTDEGTDDGKADLGVFLRPLDLTFLWQDWLMKMRTARL